MQIFETWVVQAFFERYKDNIAEILLKYLKKNGFLSCC